MNPVFKMKFLQLLFHLEHKCDFPGCKNVLVLDGNMKNHRDICLARDAGYIQHPGLPGHIKTGCMATPAFKSNFCNEHSVRSRLGSNSTEEGITMLYSYVRIFRVNMCKVQLFIILPAYKFSRLFAHKSTIMYIILQGTKGAVVEVLLATKETRGSKYYQVSF